MLLKKISGLTLIILLVASSMNLSSFVKTHADSLPSGATVTTGFSYGDHPSYNVRFSSSGPQTYTFPNPSGKVDGIFVNVTTYVQGALLLFIANGVEYSMPVTPNTNYLISFSSSLDVSNVRIQIDNRGYSDDQSNLGYIVASGPTTPSNNIPSGASVQTGQQHQNNLINVRFTNPGPQTQYFPNPSGPVIGIFSTVTTYVQNAVLYFDSGGTTYSTLIVPNSNTLISFSNTITISNVRINIQDRGYSDDQANVEYRIQSIDLDSDGDGIKDSVDQCDYDKEDFDGYQDTDGCPEENPPSSVSTSITVTTNPYSIKENTSTSVTVSGKLTNSNTGSGISGKTIKISLYGKTATVITDSSGFYQSSFTISIPKGTWNVEARFSGDNSHKESVITTTLSVQTGATENVRAAITDVKMSGSSFKLGDKVTTTVKVANTGNVQWTFYLGLTIQDPKNKLYDLEPRAINLKPGTEQTETILWSIPSGSIDGQYSIISAVWKNSPISDKSQVAIDRKSLNNVFAVKAKQISKPFAFSWSDNRTIKNKLSYHIEGITRSDISSSTMIFYKMDKGKWNNFLTLRIDVYADKSIDPPRVVIRQLINSELKPVFDSKDADAVLKAAEKATTIVKYHLKQQQLLYLQKEYGNALLKSVNTPFIQMAKQISPAAVDAANSALTNAKNGLPNQAFAVSKTFISEAQLTQIVGIATTAGLIALDIYVVASMITG